MTKANWSGISMERLIKAEVEPFGAQRFRISGPELRLPPVVGLSLAMVIFELATNATKYGALSTPKGEVELVWTQASGTRPGPGGRLLKLDWKESGGPAVSEPQRKGFGLSLLEGEIGYKLGGQVETSFHPEGLHVRLSIPLSK
jgi:two-component system CheB/CheR fusion protein